MQSALIWTAVFAGFLVLGVATGKSSVSEAVMRSWLVPVLGYGIASLVTVAHWLSPLEVSSGPRGIVRSKGEALALIPWSAIQSYRILGSGSEKILELQVSYSAAPERLYLSPKVDATEIEAEIRAHVHAEA
ncbi:MAG TPA: hypothetical protein VK149_04860 [Sideroxyarcus sp.]|nr:hypothetical protein [Sideroxyarcus sp.]